MGRYNSETVCNTEENSCFYNMVLCSRLWCLTKDALRAEFSFSIWGRNSLYFLWKYFLRHQWSVFIWLRSVLRDLVWVGLRKLWLWKLEPTEWMHYSGKQCQARPRRGPRRETSRWDFSCTSLLEEIGDLGETKGIPCEYSAEANASCVQDLKAGSKTNIVVLEWCFLTMLMRCIGLNSHLYQLVCGKISFITRFA